MKQPMDLIGFIRPESDMDGPASKETTATADKVESTVAAIEAGMSLGVYLQAVFVLDLVCLTPIERMSNH